MNQQVNWDNSFNWIKKKDVFTKGIRIVFGRFGWKEGRQNKKHCMGRYGGMS
jgi:hypothetical protein